MTNITGTAPMRMMLKFDGTVDELIEIAEEMSDGLDSHDLGDAMGFFITYAMFHDMEFSVKCPHPCMKHTLNAAIVFDLFEWEGIDN